MAANGTGTTVVFSPVFSATPGLTVYGVLTVDWGDITRGEVETTLINQALSPNTFGTEVWQATDIVTNGTVTITGHLNPDITPPIEGAAGTLTVDWGGLGAGNTWAASAICESFEIGIPMEDKIAFSCTFRLTTGVTVA